MTRERLPLWHERGEALPELLCVLPLLILCIAWLGQVVVLTWTKSAVNMAAFAAARSVTVFGNTVTPDDSEWIRGILGDALKVQTGWPAAAEVLHAMLPSETQGGNVPEVPVGITFACPGGGWSIACVASGRRALTVTYLARVAAPLLGNDRLRITAASPYVIQHRKGDRNHDIAEVGDNASR